LEHYKGDVIHPQHWPENYDYSGKRVVIIGSGATAVTLVPAMTDKAAHVIMLQRSPTYVATVPEEDLISKNLRHFLPEIAVTMLLESVTFYFSVLFINYLSVSQKPSAVCC